MYIEIAKEELFHFSRCFGDAYDGKTIPLDLMKDWMAAMYPNVNNKV